MQHLRKQFNEIGFFLVQFIATKTLLDLLYTCFIFIFRYINNFGKTKLFCVVTANTELMLVEYYVDFRTFQWKIYYCNYKF